MKARYVLLPVVVFGALSLVGACSSDSGSSTGGTGATGGAAEGGNGTVIAGATSSMGDQSAGGQSSTNGGAPVGGESMATGGMLAEAGATTAAGGAGGAPDLCAALNLDCPNDDNPCTEDACNPATGECGIPRTGTDCDDNIYCNGTDLCDAGKCTTHSGNPCASNTCDEPGKSCQCATKDDCSADQPGDWSDCTYADDCVTTGTQSRPVTSYTCTTATGKCVGKATIETRACTRETQGIACTSDGKRCDGAETCKAGKCTPANVNPCTGNAAGSTFCSEYNAECGACSGDPVQSAYAGCSSGQWCCYNNSVASAWACENAKCPISIKTVLTTTKLTTFTTRTLP